MSRHWSEPQGRPPRAWTYWAKWAAFVVFICILLPLLLVRIQVAKWIGRKTLEVHVHVIDSDVPQAVPDATITIFEGPETPIEGRVSWRKQTDFVPDPESSKTETGVTDSEGICRLPYSFTAYGSDGPLVHSGSVIISRAWLQVSAPNRPTTLIPVDGRSARVRDINDKSPVYITVVLNKCKPD